LNFNGGIVAVWYDGDPNSLETHDRSVTLICAASRRIARALSFELPHEKRDASWGCVMLLGKIRHRRSVECGRDWDCRQMATLPTQPRGAAVVVAMAV